MSYQENAPEIPANDASRAAAQQKGMPPEGIAKSSKEEPTPSCTPDAGSLKEAVPAQDAAEAASGEKDKPAENPAPEGDDDPNSLDIDGDRWAAIIREEEERRAAAEKSVDPVKVPEHLDDYYVVAPKENRITGKDAAYAALDQLKYPPVKIERANAAAASPQKAAAETTPSRAATESTQRIDKAPNTVNPRTAAPRVRKPSPIHPRICAPTGDYEGYRARLRETFGNTMSDEFVDVMLGMLVEALQPNPHYGLDEPTFNAALAMVHSAQCDTELEVFVAVQIVATGFAGFRFLRRSQRFLVEEYIDVYGGYARSLLRLQMELIQTLERMRRGGKAPIIGNVNIESGAQVLSIVQQPAQRRKPQKARR
jgi:hypothetical protein